MTHTFRVLQSYAREAWKSFSRSPKWPGIRDAHLKEFPTCAACGREEHVQVHHEKPFHKYPALELDPKNLVTLCMSTNECHLLIGHGGAFHYFNPRVVPHSEEVKRDPGTRPRVEVEAKNGRRVNEF